MAKELDISRNLRLSTHAALSFIFAFLAIFSIQFSPAIAQVAAGATFDGFVSDTVPLQTGSFSDIDSTTWKNALHVSAFEDFTTRRPASEKTDAYFLFGTDAIYCIFVLQQTTTSIVAKQTSNNVGLGLDDYVSLMFDTSGNGTNQYYFETTPAGVRYQQASESTRYNPTWVAHGAVSGDRWLAELSIPYRFLRGSVRTWRVNFARYIAGSQHVYTWAYESQMSTPYGVTYWPALRNAPSFARRLAKPTAQVFGLAATGKDAQVYEGAATEIKSTLHRSLGADAKVPISASVNFDATLFPDFSNLENDQQTISPQEFRYQYSEYRPFFTQGANYLPGSEVFYSPSIGVFDHGEKIEGQVGHLGIGLLSVGKPGAFDRAYGLTYSAPNQETTVGFYGARAGRPEGSDSVVEIVAGNTNRLSQITYGAATAVETGSFVKDVSEARRSVIYAGVAKANYALQAAYYDIGPSFRPVDAYVSQSDIRGPQISASFFSTTSSSAPVRQVSISGYLDRYLDRSGAVHEADSGMNASLTFKNLLTASLGQSLSSLRSYSDGFPRYRDGATYLYQQNTASLSYRSGTPDSVYMTYSWGAYPSYYLQQLNGSISHRLSRRYSAEFDYGQVDERNVASSADGQILRRLRLFGSLSSSETVNFSYRVIQGQGGFSTPGKNFALGYYRRFQSGSTIQAEIGSPASARTLDRYIVKYIIFLGAGSGE